MRRIAWLRIRSAGGTGIGCARDGTARVSNRRCPSPMWGANSRMTFITMPFKARPVLSKPVVTAEDMVFEVEVLHGGTRDGATAPL